ncbi:MAG: hypothetical protein IIZ35_00470, partial [Clostridia bacterium]|nr:hypothetical protein [Clostridia bacterium]
FNVLECKYIDDAVTQFNERIEAIVSECRTLYDVDIEFCPIEKTFDGHEAYSILKTPYIRRIEFGKNDQDIKESIDVAEKDFISFYSMHPNELGQKAYADCVNETIRSVEEKRHGSEQVLDPWLQYYYRFIMDREYLSLSPGRFSDEAPHLFGLHDMDGNGIPELLVYNGKLTRDADGCIVYTYRGSIEEVDGLVFCEWMNDGDVGLSYIDNYWYPGLFSSEASTGLIYTEYFTVDAKGAIKSENVEIYDWSDGTTVSRTSDDSLYSLYKGGNLKPLPMYTYEEIMNMDWSAFAAEEPGQYEDLWTAVDRSGVRRYLLMTYEEIRGEAGELEWVYMMPDEFLFYNYCFKEMPGYAFDFDADFVDAVGATDCFEIEGSEAERYIDASVQCRGLCVTPLSRLGFIGSTDAKEIGATVYDFMDEGEVWFAEVERGGFRYLFFCDENGIITGDNACWILPN